jgi:hypothetical protein
MTRTFLLLLGAAAVTVPDPLQKFKEKYEQEYAQDVEDRTEGAAPSDAADLATAVDAAGEPEAADATAPEEQVPGADDLLAALGGAPDEPGKQAHASVGDLMNENVMSPSDIKDAIEKMRASAKMMVVLHVLLKPIATKLGVAMEKMSPKDKAQAQGVIKHMDALDALSKKSTTMLSAIDLLEKSPPEYQEEGLGKIMLGMKAIQDGVHLHMVAMKNPVRPMVDQEKVAQKMAQQRSPALAKLDTLTASLHQRVHDLQ